MYVCVCNAVTEQQVKQAINEGAITTGQLRQKLDVVQQCGSCNDYLEDYLTQAFTFGSVGLEIAVAD